MSCSRAQVHQRAWRLTYSSRFLRVAQDGGTAGHVERLDTDAALAGDLSDVFDAELALRLELEADH